YSSDLSEYTTYWLLKSKPSSFSVLIKATSRYFDTDKVSGPLIKAICWCPRFRNAFTASQIPVSSLQYILGIPSTLGTQSKNTRGISYSFNSSIKVVS